MSVRCVTYGGRLGWFLRKHFSRMTSDAYLNAQYLMRKNLYRNYINYFNQKEPEEIPLPCLVSIETVNRCNSTCSFCSANRNQESRPYQKMSEELFYKIIEELEEMEYNGYLNLYVNNEPLIDNRIEKWYQYAKEKLPHAKMLLYTNGLLLTIDRFRNLTPHIDKMIINNYSETLKLHDNIQAIYKIIKKDPVYKGKDITIQIRYINEVLTNRAGNAPNKQRTRSIHRECIMPYTDITIYPNGTLGLCCSDVLEKTNLGNVNDKKIIDIWRDIPYKKVRKLLETDRENFEFCKGCDFFDAGIRNIFIKRCLSDNKLIT